jgi:predicted MFS family arabinose efflux permease
MPGDHDHAGDGPTAIGPSLVPAGLSAWSVALLAVATGLTVASLYYAQPLLDEIRLDMGLSVAGAGLIVTASQVGYAVGLLFLVPLGDLCERRRLAVLLTLGSAAALAGTAASPSAPLLYCAIVLVGVLSASAQVLVALAASLAAPADRGRVVGTVMSGLLLGVLLARTASGYVAQAGGWRLVFWLAALLMLLLALVLRSSLPRHREDTRLSYRALLGTVPVILKEEPILRLRSLYGALSFGCFSIMWTPLALLLSGPPFGYGSGTIGMFGLAGVAGALAASVAGRLADRGWQRRMTGTAGVLMTVAWLLLWLGGRSASLLAVGVVLLDLAAQGLHITNQSEIYRLRPEARSRITAAYMTIFFLGGVVGSALSSLVFAHAGWTGVCLLGAGDGGLAVVLWLVST